MEEQFCRTKLAVVIKAHGMAVSACIVNDEDVAVVNFRKGPVDSKFIAVFAERSRYVVDMILRRVFLAHDSDMVIRTVHAGTHEVSHAGVDANVFLPDMFMVNRRRDEITVRTCNGAAAFKRHADIAETGRNHDFFVMSLNALAEFIIIDEGLFRFVGQSNAAAEIEKFDVDADVLLYVYSQFKHHFSCVD